MCFRSRRCLLAFTGDIRGWLDGMAILHVSRAIKKLPSWYDSCTASVNEDPEGQTQAKCPHDHFVHTVLAIHISVFGSFLFYLLKM